ncbi:MAG: radical SAM protein [Gemmiger sp.]|nr:radical SAM protein [Gemmiger sp.]
MAFMTPAEETFLRRHLDTVRHITLDPGGPGVVRIHLVPRRGGLKKTPYIVILNGQDILPVSVSWSILLANFMDVLQPLEGQEIEDGQWDALLDKAAAATAKVYRRTPPEQIRAELKQMLDAFCAIARGEDPGIAVQPMDLGQYAPHMLAPHRLDLMVSAMLKDGSWHCNQKCLHCYAANQPLAEAPELDTDQWLAILQKCRAAGVPQVTFTGGEPTLRNDLVALVRAAQWFVTRLNTNARLLTPPLCRELYDASLDAVQVTLYAADAATHNTLVGAPGFADTLDGMRNALAAGLNVSINTPLCSLNRDYRATLALAHELGIRYATCSGLIPTGGAATEQSKATRLTEAELTETLRDAMQYATEQGMELNFTSPGWLPADTLRALGFTQVPSCGACLSNMAIAPDGTVLPCQSWLTGPGLGNILHSPWARIWKSPACRHIRYQSAKMEGTCQLAPTNL